MSRALEEALDGLHALLADSLAADLKAAREKRDESGKPVPVPASLLEAVRKYLKDNGIDAPARSPRLTGLADELAQINVDDPSIGLPN